MPLKFSEVFVCLREKTMLIENYVNIVKKNYVNMLQERLYLMVWEMIS